MGRNVHRLHLSDIVFELLLHPESERESSLPREPTPAPSRRGGHVHRGGPVHRVIGQRGRHGDNFGFFPLQRSCATTFIRNAPCRQRVIHHRPPAWSPGHRPAGSPQTGCQSSARREAGPSVAPQYPDGRIPATDREMGLVTLLASLSWRARGAAQVGLPGGI